MSTETTQRFSRRFAFAYTIAASAILFTLPAARAADPKSDSGPGPSEDLKVIQGVWERRETDDKASYRRATKDIRGNKEIVTYYDEKGAVVRRHQVDFTVARMGDVKVFTYTEMEVIEGPQKGTKMPGPVSYVYWANDKYFREAWGFLPGQENPPALLLVWRKVGRDGPEAGLAAATEKADAGKSLDGTWRPVSSNKGGREEPEDQFNRYRFILKDRTFTVERDGQMMLRGTYAIDASKSPATIDMTIEENAQNPDEIGKVARGIIEHSGDSLKWCSAPPEGGERPTEFKPKDGTEQMMIVFKRE